MPSGSSLVAPGHGGTRFKPLGSARPDAKPARDLPVPRRYPPAPGGTPARSAESDEPVGFGRKGQALPADRASGSRAPRWALTSRTAG
jgi:hypothetical protein